jgi:hypothetical protein
MSSRFPAIPELPITGLTAGFAAMFNDFATSAAVNAAAIAATGIGASEVVQPTADSIAAIAGGGKTARDPHNFTILLSISRFPEWAGASNSLAEAASSKDNSWGRLDWKHATSPRSRSFCAQEIPGETEWNRTSFTKYSTCNL